MTRVAIACVLLVVLGCAREPVAAPQASAAEPAAPTPARALRPVFVEAIPPQVDLGTVFVGAKPQGSFRLINTSDEPVRIAGCRTSCKCAAADCPLGQEIAPGGEVELTVTLDAEYPRMLTQRVTVVLDGHAPVQVPVKVTVINFVSVEPMSMDPVQQPDGMITLLANDGQPFRVLGAEPALLKRLPDGAATTHELIIDWASWDHTTRLLRIEIDHPLVKRVQVELAPKPYDSRTDERSG